MWLERFLPWLALCLGSEEHDRIKDWRQETKNLCSSFMDNLTDRHDQYLPAHRWAPGLDGNLCYARDFAQGRRLGSGSFGTVYQGTHLPTNRSVALKYLQPPPAPLPTDTMVEAGERSYCRMQFLSLIRNEECIHARLDHPAIPKFYCSYLEEDGRATVLVMELIDGRDLFDIVNPSASSESDSKSNSSSSNSSSSSNKSHESAIDDHSTSDSPEYELKPSSFSINLNLSTLPIIDDGQEHLTPNGDESVVSDRGTSEKRPLLNQFGATKDSIISTTSSSSQITSISPSTSSPCSSSPSSSRSGSTDNEPPFSYFKLRIWTSQLVHVIAYLHSLDIIFSDLKLENLMIDAAGNLRLIDFGLARWWSGPAKGFEGGMIGTPRYMSPEHLSSTGVNLLPASDWYSVGIIFHELLYRRGPYSSLVAEEGPLEEYIQNVTRWACNLPIKCRHANAHPRLGDLLEGLCAIEPDKRVGYDAHMN